MKKIIKTRYQYYTVFIPIANQFLFFVFFHNLYTLNVKNTKVFLEIILTVIIGSPFVLIMQILDGIQFVPFYIGYIVFYLMFVVLGLFFIQRQKHYGVEK